MKPKVAFFDFASCEGCQLAVLNCEDNLLELLELIDIVEFREALSERAPRYDLAFIEGSINREEDAERLRDIRSRTGLLVALGSCASMGNVQARSTLCSPAANFANVYGVEERDRVQTDPEHWPLWAHTRVRRVEDVVKVDYHLRGCPIVPSEFLALVTSLLAGSSPRFQKMPVCVECKRAGNRCVFERKGSRKNNFVAPRASVRLPSKTTGSGNSSAIDGFWQRRWGGAQAAECRSSSCASPDDTCMGQITWAGCGAVCISHGYRCDGCRGILPGANLEAHRQLLRERGMSDDDIDSRYRLFCTIDVGAAR